MTATVKAIWVHRSCFLRSVAWIWCCPSVPRLRMTAAQRRAP
uniref:Uncharacterized protein n=1 Tax=Anguilla anguilla TaxID=7936 RepID=A0A0E9UU96_ANGAN